MSLRYVLVVNGLDAPLLRQFGCDCARCRDPQRTANTSVSLIGLAGDETRYHVLFDVGQGVVDSLVTNPLLAGRRARLDWIVLTHWHPDHVLNLNRLCVSWRLEQKRRGREPARVRLWCRRGSAAWLQTNQSFEWQFLLDPCVSDESQPPGHLLAPLPLGLPGVTVTPVTVAHRFADIRPDDRRATLYSCTAYIIDTATTKSVLLWDLDSTNEWIVAPANDAQATAVARLQGADHLFVDTSFWGGDAFAGETTNHPTFANVRRYVAALQPRGETLLVHLSGHPDGRGRGAWGWRDADWQAAADRAWAADRLPGRVRVPAIGDLLRL